MDQPEPAVQYLSKDFEDKGKVALYHGLYNVAQLLNKSHVFFNQVFPQHFEGIKTELNKLKNVSLNFSNLFKPELKVKGQITKSTFDTNAAQKINFATLDYNGIKKILLDVAELIRDLSSLNTMIQGMSNMVPSTGTDKGDAQDANIIKGLQILKRELNTSVTGFTDMFLKIGGDFDITSQSLQPDS